MAKGSFKPARVYFLDADDTMWDTIGTQWQKHIYIAKTHYGKRLTKKEIREHYGRPMGQYVCAQYGTNDEEQALKHSMDYRRQFPKRLFPYTLPTLRCLRTAGVLRGVVTTGTRAGFDNDRTAMQIPARLLNYTQTADESPFLKPDRRVFDPALTWLMTQGIEPDEACYVGDALDDGRAALSAGLRFLGVRSGLVTAREFHRELGAISIPHIGYLVQPPIEN
ncbi:MAG TPA: HAD hydrolase-like protein [Candidatus Saccharimonadales bacterium]|nr:HAD hydrolase-like protein [Candidatus Saccharimonadales bacterium]